MTSPFSVNTQSEPVHSSAQGMEESPGLFLRQSCTGNGIPECSLVTCHIGKGRTCMAVLVSPLCSYRVDLVLTSIYFKGIFISLIHLKNLNEIISNSKIYEKILENPCHIIKTFSGQEFPIHLSSLPRSRAS